LTISAPKVLRFPHRRSVGTLYAAPFEQPEEWELLTQVRGLIVSPENQPIKWEWLEEARGNVTLPHGAKIKLKMSTKGTTLSALDAVDVDALHALDLGHSEVTDSALKHVSRLSGLKVLELTSTNVGDEGLASVAALSNLQSLGLSHSRTSNLGLSYLKDLLNLREIWFSGTDVDDEGLSYCQKLTRLVQLGLSGTKITDQGLKSLEQLKDLLRVYLFNTKVTHNGTQAFRKALPNCRVKWHPTKIHTQDAEETDFEGDYFNTERDEVSLLSNELSRAAPVMNEDMFWQLIDLLDWDKAGDDGAVLQPAVDALAELNVEDICAFSEILAQKLHQLDGEAYAREIGKDAFKGLKGDFSQNWFLYVRCCAVANGREIFEQIVLNPAEMPKDIEFQALLALPSKAYRKLTGQRFHYEPTIRYETFSNHQSWVLDPS
jgi:hypothetical protein